MGYMQKRIMYTYDNGIFGKGIKESQFNQNWTFLDIFKMKDLE